MAAALSPIPASASSTGESATLDQCTNGPVSPLTPQPCVGSNISGVTATVAGLNGGAAATYKNWVNGNSNGAKSHWRESEFIPYRVILNGLTSGSHTVVIAYDTVHSGGHALDYLGSFDATETTLTSPAYSGATLIHADNSNPCSDLVAAGQMQSADCVPGTPSAKTATPAENLGPAAGGGETGCGGAGGSFAGSQVSGTFDFFGPGTFSVLSSKITSDNAPSGTGQCTTTVQISFSTSVAMNANQAIVIAWGGHIASSVNWGVGNSASSISGSPYHMALVSLDGASTGSQDRALATSAIFFTPAIATSLSQNTVNIGSSVFDTATLAGAASTAAGTVTYKYFTDANCTQNAVTVGTVTVANGVVPNSPAVPFNAAGTFYWQATYSGDGNDIGPVSSPCASEILVVTAPKLVLTKVADQATVSAGDTIGYTVTLSNTGSGAATNVSVSDTLPTNAGLSWSIAGQSGGWSITSGVLSFSAASFAPGASASVHITSPTTAATCGIVNNSAGATSGNAGGPSAGPVSITVDCPALSITKTADASPVSTGTAIGFVITVSNSGAAGTGNAYNVVVTDPLPSGSGISWSIAGQSGTACSIASGTLTCNIGTLAPGAGYSVHITSPTNSTSAGSYPNTATVSASNAPSQQASATVVVLAPNLVLTKTADAGTVSAGDPIGYTVTLTNTGLGTAANVAVTDTLPGNAGLSWSIASQSGGWSITNGVLSYGAASFGPNATATVHITSPTTNGSCGVINNSASATSGNDGSPTVGPISITVNCPALSITKSADASPVNTGDNIGFVVTVSNSGAAGTGNAYNVVVSDPLPAGSGISWAIATQSGTACSIASGNLTCNLGTMTPGTTYTVHITSATTAASAGTYSNTATVSASNAPSQNASAAIVVLAPNLVITKTADSGMVSAGDTIGYTVTLTNTGQGTAYNVSVSDVLPANPGLSWIIAGQSGGWSISNTGVLSYTATTFAPGMTATVHITSITTSATCGTVNNSASALSTNDGSPTVGPISIVINCPGVSITKQADASPVSTGDQIGFAIVVSNSGAAGTGNAYNVAVSDPLPVGSGISWSIASQSGTACSIGAGALTCNIGTMAPGATYSVHIISGTTAASAGSYPNTATVSASNAPNQSASATVVVQAPNLSVTKTPDNAVVSTSDDIGFTVVVGNSSAAGTGNAYNVMLSDLLPSGSGVSWSVDKTSAGVTCSIAAGTLNCNLGNLAPGASATVHITSGTTAASAGLYPNTATATPSNGSSASGSGTIVVQAPNLAVTKTPDQGTVNTGDHIGFTITVSNSSAAGTGNAYNVMLSDPLPSGTGVSWSVDGVPAGATCGIAAGVLNCSLGNLAPGASATVHISSGTTAASAGTYPNTATATPSNGSSASGSGTITVQAPSLSVTKTPDQTPVSTGDKIGFSIVVSNSGVAGTGTAYGVVLNDPLPSGTGVSWSVDSAPTGTTCAIAAGILNCSLGNLAPGAGVSIHITSGTNASSAGTYPNTATATPSNGSSASGSGTIVVEAPSLSVTKTPDQATVNTGDNIGFSIAVSNSAVAGTGNAYNVMLSDPLPSGTGISWSVDGVPAGATCGISAGVLNCSLGNLSPGASVTIHITSATSASSAGTYPNTATATPSNGSSASGSGTITVQAPNVGLAKTADSGTVNAGSPIGYTVTVSNTGLGTAYNVAVSDTLPGNAGLSWTIASQSGGWSISNGVLSYSAASLASNATATVHITSPTTTATCGTINNSASASGSNGGNSRVGPISITVNCPTAVTTQLSGGNNTGAAITVPTGTAVRDLATITGAAPGAGGTVSYAYTTDPTCATGLVSAGTATVVSGIAGPSNPITFNSAGLVYWVAKYSGDPATDTQGSSSACGSEVLTVFSPQISQITPTNTTCQQFANSLVPGSFPGSGTSSTLGNVFYSTSGSTLSNDNPGVFFYWVKLTVTSSGTHVYTITQSTNYSPTSGARYFALASGSFAYDGGCNTVSTSITGSSDALTVTFSGAPGTYYIGIKYSAKTIVGSGPANPTSGSSYNYTFATTGVGGSSSGIQLTHS